MLYTLVPLALALAPTPTDHTLIAGAICSNDFSRCDHGVDPMTAQLHHITALKESAGVLANAAVRSRL